MAEIKIVLENEDEKSKIEFEAGKLGLSQTAFMRLLFKNWIGEVRLERKDDSNNSNQANK
jgi:hypothetical protein